MSRDGVAEKGLKAANIVKDAKGEWIMKICPTSTQVNELGYAPTDEEMRLAKEKVIVVRTMKISKHYEHYFKYGDPDLSVCGFVCWKMDNTEERKKNTAYKEDVYPGLVFIMSLPKRKAIHYRCCQKVFDLNSPTDAQYESDQSTYSQKARECHARMIRDYGAVFGGFGINKDAFNFKSNANNNATVQGQTQWHTKSGVDGSSQFLHLRERQVLYGLWLVYLFKGGEFLCPH